jgi:ribosomal protein S30
LFREPNSKITFTPLLEKILTQEIPIMSTSTVLFGAVSEQKVQEVGKLLGGKVHGSLARAGKVKGQTPKVEAEEKRKKKTGRAARRAQYNRRFVMTSSAFGGKKKGPNCQADRPEVIAAQAGKSGP